MQALLQISKIEGGYEQNEDKIDNVYGNSDICGCLASGECNSAL
jgi:hypothetical protein